MARKRRNGLVIRDIREEAKIISEIYRLYGEWSMGKEEDLPKISVYYKEGEDWFYVVKIEIKGRGKEEFLYHWRHTTSNVYTDIICDSDTTKRWYPKLEESLKELNFIQMGVWWRRRWETWWKPKE